MRAELGILAGVALLGGCTATANVVGRVGPDDKVYRGTATGYMDRTGTIEMVSEDGNKCAGPFHYTGARTGVARISCDDGRVGRVDFIALGRKSGYGFGNTNDGAGIQFYFGLSDAEGERYTGITSRGSVSGRSAARPSPPRSGAAGSSGTGFVISTQGHVMTNQHVVKDCRVFSLRMPDGTSTGGEVIAADATNDLAVIQSKSTQQATAAFRSASTYRPGDEIVSFGFPLDTTLSSSGVLTTGTINSLAGLKDDSRFLQISAPTQPGNSGGPLVDTSGNVVGITTMGLVGRQGGSPQNVNFAVKDIVAKSFLQTHRIPYVEGKPGRSMTNTEIGEMMRTYVVRIRCEN